MRDLTATNSRVHATRELNEMKSKKKRKKAKISLNESLGVLRSRQLITPEPYDIFSSPVRHFTESLLGPARHRVEAFLMRFSCSACLKSLSENFFEHFHPWNFNRSECEN